MKLKINQLYRKIIKYFYPRLLRYNFSYEICHIVNIILLYAMVIAVNIFLYFAIYHYLY